MVAFGVSDDSELAQWEVLMLKQMKATSISTHFMGGEDDDARFL
jgi:hypothetical protein